MVRKEFWKNLPIDQFTKEEWESLCDGCGKCCLIKLQKNKKSQPTYTSLSCEYLNTETCRCSVYNSRGKKRSDCIILSPKNLSNLVHWLPNSCSYRLIYENKDIPNWHHLKTKDKNSVHKTENSVKNLAINEEFINEKDFNNFITKFD